MISSFFLLQKGRVSKASSRLSKTGKTSAPTVHKTPSRRLSEKSSSFIKATNKLVIVVSTTKKPREDKEEEEELEGERADQDEVEEDESITYLIKAESSIHKKASEDKSSSPRRKGKKQSDPGIFMTQDEDIESAHIAQATENIILPGGAITEVKLQ